MKSWKKINLNQLDQPIIQMIDLAVYLILAIPIAKEPSKLNIMLNQSPLCHRLSEKLQPFVQSHLPPSLLETWSHKRRSLNRRPKQSLVNLILAQNQSRHLLQEMLLPLLRAQKLQSVNLRRTKEITQIGSRAVIVIKSWLGFFRVFYLSDSFYLLSLSLSLLLSFHL